MVEEHEILKQRQEHGARLLATEPKTRWVLVSTGDMYQLVLGKTHLGLDELALAAAEREAVTFTECRYFQYTTGQGQDPNGRMVLLFNHNLLPFPCSVGGGIVTLVPAYIIDTEQSDAMREQIAAMLSGIERMEAEIRSKRSGIVVAGGQHGSVHGY